MTTAYSSSEIVEMAVQIEVCGEAFYDEAMTLTKNPKVRELFSFLRDEEQRHAALFRQILSRLVDTSAEWRQDETYLGYLRTLVEERVFPGADGVRALARELGTERAAIEKALQFEKDTLLFFYEIREMVSDASKSIVGEIIDEEKRHVRQLGGLLASLRQDTASGPRNGGL